MKSIAGSTAKVKFELTQQFSALIDRMLEEAEAQQPARTIELRLWSEFVALGAVMLGYLFAVLCRRAMQEDVATRELRDEDVRLRLDEDYWHKVTTTFGPVHFPVFAYRDQSRGCGTITRTPARSVFPYHRRCRSSELCLEWESRLGSDHPFRRAQEALTYFTHGAVQLEDTTIAQHALMVSHLVNRTHLYLSADEVKTVLATQATRDRETDRPILYMSSDAHALRRYVDETWDAQWKMANGIRLWCEDHKTGRIIHLGGEYTWGDCQQVRQAFECLMQHGILPSDGDYGDGVVAQLTWLSDGMPWFEDHILPLFKSPLVILDGYHVLERLAAYAAACYGKGSRAAKRWYTGAAALIHGRKGAKGKRTPKRRKGRKTKRTESPGHAHEIPTSDPVIPIQGVRDLLQRVAATRPKSKTGEKKREKLFWYLFNNVHRTDYASYRQRGYQIGSGAMESMHRQGSQVRLKLPGARWLKETSQAIFNLRMLQLVGNWNKFWNQPDLGQQLAQQVTPTSLQYEAAGAG